MFFDSIAPKKYSGNPINGQLLNIVFTLTQSRHASVKLKKRRIKKCYKMFYMVAVWKYDISEMWLILLLNCLTEPTFLNTGTVYYGQFFLSLRCPY